MIFRATKIAGVMEIELEPQADDRGMFARAYCEDEFRAQGLCVSSGVVEAGCKVAIGTRLKRPGMHWTAAGADAIIALRCCKLSGRFEDFWERRSAAEAGTGR